MFDQVVEWFQSLDNTYKVVVGLPGGTLVAAALKKAAVTVWDAIRPGSADEWMALGARFQSQDRKTYALWNCVEDSPRVDWSVYPTAGKATSRDVELYRAVAGQAGRLFRRPISQRVRANWIGRLDEDVWLDVVRALVSPASDTRFTGSGPEGSSVGGVINDLAEASVIACQRLAIGDGPRFWISAVAMLRTSVLRSLRVRRVERRLREVQ